MSCGMQGPPLARAVPPLWLASTWLRVLQFLNNNDGNDNDHNEGDVKNSND